MRCLKCGSESNHLHCSKCGFSLLDENILFVFPIGPDVQSEIVRLYENSESAIVSRKKIKLENGEEVYFSGRFAQGRPAVGEKGKCEFQNGNVFEGVFRDNGFVGGTLLFKNGDRFEGDMLNWNYGKGTIYFKNGDRFEGDILNWDYGRGTVYFKNGDRFEGVLSDDTQSKGKFIKQDGTIYEGTVDARELCEGNVFGQGVIAYKNGDSYRGGVHNGVPEGEGRLAYADGIVYQGTFHNGTWNGKGLLIDLNKDLAYSGNFIDGKLVGEYTTLQVKRR